MNDHGAFPALRAVLRRAVPRPLRKRAFQLLQRTNVQTRPQPPMREDTRRRLEAHFRDDVARLSGLLGRDLVALWYPAAVAEHAVAPAA
jgi:hypothetical protein